MNSPQQQFERAAQVAKLARLKLTDAELSEIETYLDQMLGAFQSLQEVDTTGVAPLMNPNEGGPSDGGFDLKPEFLSIKRSDRPRLFDSKSVLKCSENCDEDDFTVVAE